MGARKAGLIFSKPAVSGVHQYGRTVAWREVLPAGPGYRRLELGRYTTPWNIEGVGRPRLHTKQRRDHEEDEEDPGWLRGIDLPAIRQLPDGAPSRMHSAYNLVNHKEVNSK